MVKLHSARRLCWGLLSFCVGVVIWHFHLSERGNARWVLFFLLKKILINLKKNPSGCFLFFPSLLLQYRSNHSICYIYAFCKVLHFFSVDLELTEPNCFFCPYHTGTKKKYWSTQKVLKRHSQASSPLVSRSFPCHRATDQLHHLEPSGNTACP